MNISTTPEVQYGYSVPSLGSLKTSMTYPDGRKIDYNYNSGIDASIGRLSSLSDDSTGTVLESYKYLGLGTVVERDHPEDGVNLTYISSTTSGDGGDQYVGLDRFGRVVDQNWVNSSGTTVDEYQYGYDTDGNVLYKLNTVSPSNSELYGYDSLNRLTSFERGTLATGNTSISGTPSRTQTYTLDALGNQTSVTTNGTAVSQSYNSQNELTAAGSATLAYDNAGNNTTDQSGNTYTYDAWNRQTGVKNASGTAIEGYAYDADGRRIEEQTQSGSPNNLYYSDQWQVLEERNSSNVVKEQYVWSPVYVNALIERDRDADNNAGTGPNGLEERLYATQDANWNTTSLINTSGTVVERDQYDPYGAATFLAASFTPLSGNTSAYASKYLFQGGRYDPTTGMYDFEHRDENPATGAWEEQDPAGYVDGADLYQAEGSSPLGRADADGQLWQATNTQLTIPQATQILQDQIIEWESDGQVLPGHMLNHFLYGHGTPYTLTEQDIQDATDNGLLNAICDDIINTNRNGNLSVGVPTAVGNTFNKYFAPLFSGDLFWGFASLQIVYNGTITLRPDRSSFCYDLNANVSKNYNFSVQNNSGGGGSHGSIDTVFEVFRAGAVLELAKKGFPFNVNGDWQSKGSYSAGDQF